MAETTAAAPSPIPGIKSNNGFSPKRLRVPGTRRRSSIKSATRRAILSPPPLPVAPRGFSSGGSTSTSIRLAFGGADSEGGVLRGRLSHGREMNLEFVADEQNEIG